MNPEIIDNINKPIHYQGRYGMESIDALRDFMRDEQLKVFLWVTVWSTYYDTKRKMVLRIWRKLARTQTGLLRRWSMRIKTSNGSIINVDKIKHSITIDGVEYGSDCSALVSKNKDGTGTITLIFEGKIIWDTQGDLQDAAKIERT